ncbi:hypothetical protein [Faucicola atlantae]|uniref:Uncharacterized protein n=1 Tax=Faucicola atlantae TaxID=34059 RepID=A0A1B8QCU0_9GAMM|nr:hypothetical protein [Moraxella atlantae]OBX79128.1 hypothetical protein A9306_08940 [Moraxella atlantae]
MTLINFINVFSVAVIAIVCVLSIIKYHRQFGWIITVTVFMLMLSCISVIFDEYDGTRGVFALPIFRVLLAISSVIVYLKAKRFWSHYGIFITALKNAGA